MKTVGIAIIGLICIVIFKQIKPEFAFFMRLAIILVFISVAFSELERFSGEISAYHDVPVAYFTYFKIALKVLGICYLSQTGSDICRDCGESALAAQVELIGRIATVSVALPVIKELIKFSINLI